MRLRRGAVIPVVGRTAQHVAQRGRHVDPEIQSMIGATGFEERDTVARLYETARKGTAGRTGTNDNIIGILQVLAQVW